MGLSTAASTRAMRAILIHTWKVPVDHWIMMAIKEATTQFVSAQTHLKEEEGLDGPAIKEKLGIPAAHSYNAVIKHMMKKMEEDGGQEELLRKVQNAVKEWEKVENPIKVLISWVPHFRSSKMYHGTHR
eukprot:3946250-Karenia_brevis.AAC.1